MNFLTFQCFCQYRIADPRAQDQHFFAGQDSLRQLFGERISCIDRRDQIRVKKLFFQERGRTGTDTGKLHAAKAAYIHLPAAHLFKEDPHAVGACKDHPVIVGELFRLRDLPAVRNDPYARAFICGQTVFM